MQKIYQQEPCLHFEHATMLAKKEHNYHRALHDCAGYVHGTHPEICAKGCKPSMEVGKGETKKQTLIREALEFQARRRCLILLIMWLKV